ncbi:hypothetical protein ACU4HD_45965 (plasmid) [Cupriavidus basilensis]
MIIRSTGHGAILRLVGKGIRDAKTDNVGDLRLRVAIDIPKGEFSEEKSIIWRRFAGLTAVVEPVDPPAREAPESETPPVQPSMPSRPATSVPIPRRTSPVSVTGFVVRGLDDAEYQQYNAAIEAFESWEAALPAEGGGKAPSGNVAKLREDFQRVADFNRMLLDGHAPTIVIQLLETFRYVGVIEQLTVIGNYAILAYEAAAGVCIQDAGRHGLYNKRIQFIARRPVEERWQPPLRW